jgi:Ger(x)C family germination protein
MKSLTIFLKRKKKINKLICLILLIHVSSLLLSGCFSYIDINKLIFATSIIVDIDKDDRPIIYLEGFKPYRSTAQGSEKGQRVLVKGTGKTAYEALRDVNLATSFKINFTQYKALIFTKRAAQCGIDYYIDLFHRDQEFVIRPYIVVTDESPEDLLNTKIAASDYLGIALKDLIDNEGASTRSVRLALNEYLNRRLIGSETAVVTLVGIKKNQPEERVEIEGGAIFKDDKMMGILERSDGQGYNFLMNTLKTGSLEISNPDKDNQFISLNVLSNRTKTDISYNGTTVKLKKRIFVKTTIEEIQKQGRLTDDVVKKIEEKSEDNIKEACERVFEKYKEQDLDIFRIKETLERKYPKVNIDNPLKITELEVEVVEDLEGSSDTQDFWD